MALLLRLLLLCLWPLGPLSASEIMPVGAEDQPGIRSFIAALESRRPHDHVQFRTTANLPRPGKLKADQRLILLDSAALEWRLGETAGPPALVMRVSRVQAEQRLGKSRPAFLTLLWSDAPLGRQLRLARYFGFAPEYWVNMQTHYNLEIIRRQSMRQIEKEVKPREAA